MNLLAKSGLSDLSAEQPVLIAGPTASGKSALALEIAQTLGGVIVNADASQVYDCWRVVTACPDEAEEAAAPHALYRYVPYDAPFSAGHWLRAVTPFVNGDMRPIIVGGTGLNFAALTQGLADIPATPPEIRSQGDALSLGNLLAGIDSVTRDRIDTQNRMRVQRAWEVQQTTGRSLSVWQDDTPPPLLNTATAACLVVDAPKDWLNERIARRFDLMIKAGALEEIAAMSGVYDPALPSCRAIGVPELMACHRGALSLAQATEQAVIATRQYAKRQRTWFRSRMRGWRSVDPEALS